MLFHTPANNFIREEFNDYDCIWIPCYDGEDIQSKWVESYKCIWDGPDYIMSCKPLKALYEKAFQGSPVDIDELGRFFQKTVGVENIQPSDIIDELRLRKKNEHLADTQVILEIYRLLHRFITEDDSIAGEVR